jgi:hypothetical protein
VAGAFELVEFGRSIGRHARGLMHPGDNPLITGGYGPRDPETEHGCGFGFGGQLVDL